jgi:hypothetical protein
MVFNNNLLLGAAGAGGGYTIDQSIRFDKTASSHLSNTYGSAGNRRTWTFSTWFKRGKIDASRQILFAATGQAYLQIGPDAAAREMITILNEGTGTDLNWYTTAVYRDPSAWYHLVWQFDSTQATADDRTKLYINGSQVTDFTKAATPAQNFEGAISNAVEHKIGEGHTAANYYDGYMAEIHFIDGTALDPTSFGETNNDGVWVPIEYTNAAGYGTNGFYITGEDSTFLGQDVRTSGDQVNSFQAAQYTGATSDYTFSDGRVEADVDNRAIRTVDTFTGDFEFTWRYVNMANFVIGLYEIDEDATFSSTSSAGNMQSMTDSWYVQTSSVASNRDIYYGGTVVVDSTTIANGDVWKMTRESGTIKVYRNGSLIHTYAQTSTNEVRLVIAQGDAAADANQIAWVDNSTLGNNFFSSGLATTDQMLDTPTDNFCTLNAVDKATQVVLADGNLQYGLSSNSYTAVRGTFGVSSGKWYWEMSTVSGMGLNTCYMGIANSAAVLQTSGPPPDGTVYGYISYTGNKFNTSSISYGDTWNTNGRVIGIALDLDAGKIWWSRDGVWQASGDPAAGTNEAFSGITGTWHPYVIFNDFSPNLLFNFGQSAFTYTPPTGFNTLSTANLATPSIKDGSAHFQTTVYTGNGTAIGSGGLEVNQSENSTFQPDFAWIKNRTTGGNEHDLYDAVRGATKVIFSSTTGAEATVSEGLASFDTDGFTVGNRGEVNTSGNSMVAWQWKANGAGSSNTDGTINTTATSANTTAGFSISTYTGNGTSGATIGHGLGLVPALVIVKRRDGGSGYSWYVQHKDVGPTKALFLDSASAGATSANYWNNTAPTSSVFSVGNDTSLNANSGTFLAYCFAEIPGYSSIGSYEGNSSTDGPFIYTGFKPSFVLIKNVDAAEEWWIQDDAREPFNGGNMARLAPNSSAAEADNVPWFDFLSNGLKVRYNAGGINTSGTHIYMAFAEHPFGGDGVAPATAR